MEEDMMEEDNNVNADNKNFLDRLVLNCVQIPGSPNQESDMKVLVYEYDNDTIKINEERLFIGVAYVIMGKIEIHSWFSIKDYSKIIYPKLNYENINFYNFYKLSSNVKFDNSDDFSAKFFANLKEKLNLNFNETRDKLKLLLTDIFGGDELLSEYFILYLTSRVYSRYATIVTGKLCLNITKVKLEKDLKTLDINPSKKYNIKDLESSIKKLFEIISNQFIYFLFNIKNLNDKNFKSVFDTNIDELRQGFLQVVDSTFLVLDERVMEEGKLNDCGVNNLQALANLIDLQFLHYEYPYNNVNLCLKCRLRSIKMLRF